jgi:hypothetical protein
MTLLEDYLQDAFEIVSAWDLPDEDFAGRRERPSPADGGHPPRPRAAAVLH